MPEKDPSNKNYPSSIRREPRYAVSGAIGLVTGGAVYTAASARGLEDAPQLGIGAIALTTLSIAGPSTRNLSLQEAEEAKEAGDENRARAKIVQASIETSLAPGLIFGAAGASAGITEALIGGGIGVAYGTRNTYKAWKERIKLPPELVFPEGNSVRRINEFPTRHDGHKLPPLFAAESIKDFKEFRDANKKIITEWASRIPPRTQNIAYTSDTPFLSILVAIRDIKHFPALDPEDDQVKLIDGDTSILADQMSFVVRQRFWPVHTIFDNGHSFSSDTDAWERWKNQSWEGAAVLLAQYRDMKGSRKKTDPDSIEDRYWLIDINQPHDHRRRKKEKLGKK